METKELLRALLGFKPKNDNQFDIKNDKKYIKGYSDLREWFIVYNSIDDYINKIFTFTNPTYINTCLTEEIKNKLLEDKNLKTLFFSMNEEDYLLACILLEENH